MAYNRGSKDQMLGIAGVATGLTGGEFLGEVVSKASKQTGNAKLGIKAVTKVILGGILLALIGRVPGGWRMFTLLAGWTSIGSVILEFFYAIYSGGLAGAAEDLVNWAQGVGVAGRTASKELARYEVRKVQQEKGVLAATSSGRVGV